MSGVSNSLLTLCALLGFTAPNASAGDPILLTVDEPHGRLELQLSGKPLLVYRFATDQFKPYVQSLYSLSGVNVLRDSPPDHLHHHGLMYAIRVNGVNFWEETGQPGIEKPVTPIMSGVGQNDQGHSQAWFSQVIHWISSDHRGEAKTKPFAHLIEHRTLTLTVDESIREVALRWEGIFRAGSASDRVQLTGSNYNGLGLRLPEVFDHSARHANSEGAAYTPAQSGDVTSARWSAVSQPNANGQPMVALFGSPSNPGETRFFTMLNPFAYLSVTQNLDQKPLDYRIGDSYKVVYLLCVYSEPKPADFLNDRLQRWEKSSTE